MIQVLKADVEFTEEDGFALASFRVDQGGHYAILVFLDTEGDAHVRISEPHVEHTMEAGFSTAPHAVTTGIVHYHGYAYAVSSGELEFTAYTDTGAVFKKGCYVEVREIG